MPPINQNFNSLTQNINIFSFRYNRYAGKTVLNMRCCEAGRKEEVHREDNCLDKVFIFLYALFLIP